MLWAICFWGQAGYHCDEAPFALNKHIQELISPQQRVMERGLSVFCQAFDGVIDCEGYRGGGAWIQIETQSLVWPQVHDNTSPLWSQLQAADGMRIILFKAASWSIDKQ